VFPVKMLVNLKGVGWILVTRNQCLPQRRQRVAADKYDRAVNLNDAANRFRVVHVVFL
jgi:hypothetical protein